jgi:hypothetical protein
VLKDGQKSLEKEVEKGSFPLFGYQPLLFSRRSNDVPIFGKIANSIISKNA